MPLKLLLHKDIPGFFDTDTKHITIPHYGHTNSLTADHVCICVTFCCTYQFVGCNEAEELYIELPCKILKSRKNNYRTYETHEFTPTELQQIIKRLQHD